MPYYMDIYRRGFVLIFGAAYVSGKSITQKSTLYEGGGARIVVAILQCRELAAIFRVRQTEGELQPITVYNRIWRLKLFNLRFAMNCWLTSFFLIGKLILFKERGQTFYY